MCTPSFDGNAYARSTRKRICCYAMVLVVGSVVDVYPRSMDSVFRQCRMQSSWSRTAISSEWQAKVCSCTCQSFAWCDWYEILGRYFRSAVDYCSRCFHEFWLVAVVARYRLRKLLNRSLLNWIWIFQSIVNLWTEPKEWKTRCFDVPIELRLLLSPDSEWVSPALMISPLMLDVGVSVLVGRDRRRSLSTSERRGRFGVSWKKQRSNLMICEMRFGF